MHNRFEDIDFRFSTIHPLDVYRLAVAKMNLSMLLRVSEQWKTLSSLSVRCMSGAWRDNTAISLRLIGIRLGRRDAFRGKATEMRNQANSWTRPRVFSALYFNVRLPVIQMETNGSNPEGLLYFGDNKEATLQILHVSFHSYLFRIFNIVISVVVVFVVFFSVSNLLFCFDGNKEAMCKSFTRVSSFDLPDFSQPPNKFFLVFVAPFRCAFYRPIFYFTSMTMEQRNPPRLLSFAFPAI